MKLSTNFTLEEMVESEYAIRHSLDNTPSEEALQNLRALSVQVLEPLRWVLGARPITISSGYRSPEVNAGIGGSARSQHLSGMAADIKVAGMTAADVFVKLVMSNLVYDQAILEFGTWVHVSYNRFGGNRMERLVARKVDGETIYEEIWNPEKLITGSLPATST